MEREYLVVVGDRFKAFSRLDFVVAKSRLNQALAARGDRPVALIAGQGVGHLSPEALIGLTHGHDRARWVSTGSGSRAVAQADLCHKVVHANRLVTAPARTGAGGCYRMDLVVDDDNELLQDHVTGEHIPGMILVEAARQSFLAVTEKFYARPGQRYRFVTTRLQSTYHRFVFPLDVPIEYRVRNIDTNRYGRIECAATVSFYQGANSDPAAECEVEFKAYLASYVEARERRLANHAVIDRIDSTRYDEDTPCLAFNG